MLGALNKDLGQSAKARASSSKRQSQRSRPGHSLLFLFDLEATGLSVYTDCITEIAGKVFDPPVDVKQATFSSLVHTDHHIPKIGTTSSTLLLTHTKCLLYLLLNQEAIALLYSYRKKVPYVYSHVRDSPNTGSITTIL